MKVQSYVLIGMILISIVSSVSSSTTVSNMPFSQPVAAPVTDPDPNPNVDPNAATASTESDQSTAPAKIKVKPYTTNMLEGTAVVLQGVDFNKVAADDAILNQIMNYDQDVRSLIGKKSNKLEMENCASYISEHGYLASNVVDAICTMTTHTQVDKCYVPTSASTLSQQRKLKPT